MIYELLKLFLQIGRKRFVGTGVIVMATVLALARVVAYYPNGYSIP
jgi:hypothetical protein